MESVLREAINLLSWPRETIISYEIRNDGKDIWLDVDLPEIEDIPNKIATIAATRRKLKALRRFIWISVWNPPGWQSCRS